MTELITSKKRASANIRLKPIALPTEHGGWSFLLEPILLGLWIAPSWAGLALSISALGVFLLNQPARIALKDWQKGKSYPRTRWAARFCALYAGTALLMLLLALMLTLHPFWLPILVASPLALFQIWAGIRNQSRDLAPELVGATTLGATAAAIVLAGGGTVASAFVLWLILSLRSVPSILYVRARLRLERGEDINRLPVTVVHIVALLSGIVLAVSDLTHWLTSLAFGVLLFRAIHGLSAWRTPVPAKVIGIWEIIYGMILVALVAIGTR
jgi:hypothetical protein